MENGLESNQGLKPNHLVETIKRFERFSAAFLGSLALTTILNTVAPFAQASTQLPIKSTDPGLVQECRRQALPEYPTDTVEFVRNKNTVSVTLSAYDITPKCEKLLTRSSQAVIWPLNSNGVPSSSYIKLKSISQDYSEEKTKLTLASSQLKKSVGFMVAIDNSIKWKIGQKPERQAPIFIYRQGNYKSPIQAEVGPDRD